MKLYEYKGEKYTLPKLSTKVKIPSSVLWWRMSHGGMTLEEAADTPYTPASYKGRVVVTRVKKGLLGTTFGKQAEESIRSIAIKNGIQPTQLYHHVKHHSLEESLELIKNKTGNKARKTDRHPKGITIDGIKYSTLAAAARAHDIKVSRVYKYAYAAGIDTVEAFKLFLKDKGTPKVKSGYTGKDRLIRTKYIVEGVEYCSAIEVANAYGLDIDKVYQVGYRRMIDHAATLALMIGKPVYYVDTDEEITASLIQPEYGLPVRDECLSPDRSSVGRKDVACIGPDGKAFKTIADACRYYKVDIQRIYNLRKRNSISAYDAIKFTLKYPDYHAQYPSMIIDPIGNVFKNSQEMINHYGVSVTVYNRRLKQGMKIAEICGIEKPKRKLNAPMPAELETSDPMEVVNSIVQLATEFCND